MTKEEIDYMLRTLERAILKLEAKSALIEVLHERQKRAGEELDTVKGRIADLESDRTWLGRLIVGTVLVAVLTGAFALDGNV